MKTLSKILTLGLIISLFPFYGMAENSATHDEGVVINGVRWATRNVDAPGTFAPYPESSGMFFQWNRRVGWSATDYEWPNYSISGWDSSTSAGTYWTCENDPCPAGWRVPTQAELQSLNNAGSTWITQNGVIGRLYGTAPNQIFLSAVGWRTTNGSLNLVGTHGVYWSSTQDYIASAWLLVFSSDNSNVNFGVRANGFSIRCVAK